MCLYCIVALRTAVTSLALGLVTRLEAGGGAACALHYVTLTVASERAYTHPMNQSTVSRRYSGSRSSLVDLYHFSLQTINQICNWLY